MNLIHIFSAPKKLFWSFEMPVQQPHEKSNSQGMKEKKKGLYKR